MEGLIISVWLHESSLIQVENTGGWQGFAFGNKAVRLVRVEFRVPYVQEAGEITSFDQNRTGITSVLLSSS